MNGTCQDLEKVEEIFRNYYAALKVIAAKKKHLEQLQGRLEKVKKDMAGGKCFILNPDLNAVQYDRTVVDGGALPCSAMDRQIENIYTKLESEIHRIRIEMMCINNKICSLESENACAEELLHVLDEESRRLIEYRYYDRMNYFEIADKMHIDRCNVGRRMKKVLTDSLLWLWYMDESGSVDKVAVTVDKLMAKAL